MPIEVESPEELGYDTIENNLAESSRVPVSWGSATCCELRFLLLAGRGRVSPLNARPAWV